MRAVILGCGRVGAFAASDLDGEFAVTVIDWNPSSFDRLSADFGGATIVGNGIDVDVLRLGNVEEADLFMALTDTDNTNLMAAQVAKQLGAGHAIARVYDAERCAIYSEMGLTVLSPTIYGAERLFNLVVGSGKEG